MRRSLRISGLLALTISLFGPAMQSADAQYFGRNKVEYKSFKFKILKTQHFDIYYYPSERQAAQIAARMAERWYTRLSRILDHELSGRQPVILYASHPDFEQTNIIPGQIGEGTGGVTEPLRRRIVLPLAGPLAETDHVLGHELVHAFQFDMVGMNGLGNLPLWFVEGMAEYLSLGPVDANTAMWMRDALANKDVPTVRQLGNPNKYFPYRYGQAFWAYLSGVYGDQVVGQMLKRGGSMGGIDAALVGVTRTPMDTLSKRWRQAITDEYGPLRDATHPPSDYGRKVIAEESGGGKINLAPALSPDGSKLLFLSEKSQFSIELYVADARTGKVERKLTAAALDPHFQSLQFISSAGAWSPDGHQVVFAAVSGGHPILRIVDSRTGHKVRELEFKGLGEVFNPTWSPDGRYIAFSALHGGLSDLYMYDLQGNELVQLTSDDWADLEPSWSPKGDRIVFVTDRFSSDLGDLKFGNYRLAFIDPSTRQITPAPSFSRGKHIDPQWSPDGSSLYFVSNLDGISNVYRVDLASGTFHQVTNLFEGVSGITELSPAISVASRSGELAFAAYQKGGYTIYATDSQDVLAGSATQPALAGVNPAQLPPLDRKDTEVASLLANAQLGLPTDTVYPTQSYGAGLSLDHVAQTSVVAGTDPYGTFIGGGTALVFSDMLNEHQLGTLLQVNGSFQDITAAAAYQNQAHRLNWGLTGERVPFLFGGFSIDPNGVINGESATVQQEILFRQIYYTGIVTASYPFNAAQRLEFNAGYQNIRFNQEVRTFATSNATGNVLVNTKETSSPYSPLSLGTASAALVYDNAFFGATSPILGQRYRLEVSPTFGTLTWYEGLADFRRYFLPVRPFTLAFRVLHYGRYGPDSNDPRLGNIFLGYPGLVRGYSRSSFSAAECHPKDGDPCPEFDRLIGSRIAVANAELRFPLLGVLGVGSGYYGAWPLELAFFGDGGVAWQNDIRGTAVNEEAFFLGGDRKPVYSAGVALRTNLFGYLVVEFDVARAFQRHKWETQVNLIPGF